jgi:hypothetical protein
VTNIGDAAEELASAEGRFLRLMGWCEIPSHGFPYTRPPLEAYCVMDPEFCWPRHSERNVVRRAKRARMLAELMDTNEWLIERY